MGFGELLSQTLNGILSLILSLCMLVIATKFIKIKTSCSRQKKYKETRENPDWGVVVIICAQ